MLKIETHPKMLLHLKPQTNIPQVVIIPQA